MTSREVRRFCTAFMAVVMVDGLLFGYSTGDVAMLVLNVAGLVHANALELRERAA